MNVQPIHNYVLVRRLHDDVTKGGIIIPDSAKKRTFRGEVIALGPGKVLDAGKLREPPPPLRVGVTVLFQEYAGREVSIGGEDFVVLTDEEIFAVIS